MSDRKDCETVSSKQACNEQERTLEIGLLMSQNRKLLDLLSACHPVHPQPEICEACRELKRI